MLTTGPQQILNAEILVDTGDFTLDAFRRALTGGPSQVKMTAPEKYAKLLKIFTAIKDQPQLDVKAGSSSGPAMPTIHEIIRNAFFDSGLKAEDAPAFGDLYRDYIVDKLKKATFGNASEAGPKRLKFKDPLNEILDIIIDQNAYADLVALGEAIRKSGNSNVAEETIERKINEIKEKFKALELEKAAFKDPVLGPKLSEYADMREEFIRIHAELKGKLESKAIEEDDLAKEPGYKRLQVILKKYDEVQLDAAKASLASDFYADALEEEEKKRMVDLQKLLVEKDKLEKNKRDNVLRLDGISIEDISQVSGVKAIISLIDEELDILQPKIDYLEHLREEERRAADELFLLTKLNGLWMSDAKTQSSSKKTRAWKDAFKAGYYALTDQELPEEALDGMHNSLKDYNEELKVILDDPEFNKKTVAERHKMVASVTEKYERIISGPLFNNLIMAGIYKFDDRSAIGEGQNAKNAPKLKSAKYVKAKITSLQKAQQQVDALAKVFRVSNPQEAIATIASSSSGAKPKSTPYDKGFTNKGELKIQLIAEQKVVDNRVKAGKVSVEKDTLIGLVVKSLEDKVTNFVLRDEDDAVATTLSAVTAPHKFTTDGLQKAKKGLAEYTPLISALTEEQIVRLANFMGPDFSRTFDLKNPDHLDSLKDELKTKLGNSGLSMGDLMLVALGYRFRDPVFLGNFNRLKRDGFYFNAAIVNKGADFFADEVTLSQSSQFEGTKIEPLTLKAVENIGIENGALIAKINSRNARAELEGFVAEIARNKAPQAQEALEAFAAELDGGIFDLKYLELSEKLEQLQQHVPTEHPQSSLIEFLSTNPDVYSPEGKKQLAIHFANSVAKQYQIQLINQNFDKLIAEIETATEAEKEAKRKLEEQANADEEREREIARIRGEIKEDMLGHVGAAENERQTLRLDEMALRLYENLHGPKQTVVQKAEAQVGNLGNQIQQIQQRIEVVKIVGNEQDLGLLREELKLLKADKDRLELELAALRNIQQQRLEAAQVSPEQIYQQTHSVDAMLRHAALQHTAELPWSSVNQWIRSAEKGNFKIGNIIREAQEKVTIYNSNPTERKQKYGW